MTTQIAEVLRRRVRSQPAAPLLTYYDLGSGERTELSAVSFRNWVDKTSNLMVDEYQLETGDVVALALAVEAPGHWVTLVWAAACWQVGAVVDLTESASDSRLRVLGPTQVRALAPADLTVGSPELIGCSLHPLGLGFAEPLPRPLVDYSLEVRSQPDVYASEVYGAGPVPNTTPAWRDPARDLTQAQLGGLDAPPPGRRVLVRVGDPWPTVRDALVVPLLSSGSSVIVVGDDPDRLARISSDERVDAVAG